MNSSSPPIIESWKQDPEFAALPYTEKRQILNNYFDQRLTDDVFFQLPDDQQGRIRDNYFSAHLGPPPDDHTPPEASGASESTPPEEDASVVKEFGKGLARGALGVPEAAGTAIQYAGQRIKGEDRSAEFAADPNRAFARMLPSQRDDVVRKMEEYQKIIPRDQAFKKAVGEVFEADAAGRARVGDAVSDVGQTASGFWAGKQEPFAPHASIAGKTVWDNPELLLDAAWWASSVGEMLPSLAASIVPAVGTQQATMRIGGRLIASTPQAWNRLAQVARLASAGTGGLVGGALEGSQTYKEVLKETGNEVQAARAGELMTAASGVLNSIGNANFLDALGKNLFSRFGFGFVIEGVTEGAEEPAEVAAKLMAAVIEGKELPEDITQQFVESFKRAATVFPIAGLVGGGGATRSKSPARKAIADTLPVEDQEKTAAELLDDEQTGPPDPAKEIRKKLSRGEIGMEHVQALRAQVGDGHPLSRELDAILAEAASSSPSETSPDPAPASVPASPSTAAVDVEKSEESSPSPAEEPNKPEWLAVLTDDQIVKRVKNLRETQRLPIGLTEKQRVNLSLLSQEMVDRGMKPADESAAVFDEHLSEVDRLEKQRSQNQAIENLTRTSGKSAQASAQDMLIEQEIQNNRILSQNVPAARKFAKDNPETFKLIRDLPAAPSREAAASAVHGAKLAEIGEAAGAPVGQATNEALLRAKAQATHDGRKDLAKIIDDELTYRNNLAKIKPESGPKPTTLGGAIRAMGGINPVNLKKDLTAIHGEGAKAGIFKSDGTEIEKAKRALVAEGWMLPSEDLAALLTRDTEILKRGAMDAEAKTKFQKEKQAAIDTSAEDSLEAPPDYDVEGAYRSISAGEIPEGKPVGVVVDGRYGEYVVTNYDPFGNGVTLTNDSEEIILDPSQAIEIRSADLPAAKSEATDADIDADAGPDGEVRTETDQSVDIDEAAHEAATSPLNDLPEPTEAQKEVGNYRLGHIKVHGFEISVENPDGSVRSGVSKDGKKWSTPIHGHYGYFKQSEGRDNDHVDVFVAPGQEANPRAFIVDQVDPATGKFDEHKVVMGAESIAAAEKLYLSNYEKGWKGLGAITEMPLDRLKAWLDQGKQTRPVGNLPGKAKATVAEPSRSTITLDDVQQAFPGQRVSQNNNGTFEINTGSGHVITLHGVDAITDAEMTIRASTVNRIAPKGKGRIAGAYDPDTQTIRIVRGVGDRSTIKHESYHFLETSGLLKPQEVQILNVAILQKRGIMAKEEDRARFVEKELQQREFKRHSGPAQRVLQKIADFIDALVNLFKKTSAGVVRSIESGKAFDRQPAGPETAKATGTRYSTKQTPDPQEWARQFVKEHLANDPQAKEALQQIEAAATSDKVIHDEAKGLFGYVKERFGKGFVDDDMKWYDRAFGLPYWLGKKYESMKTAVDVEINAAETRSTELFRDYDGDLGRIQEKIPKNKKHMQELRDLIWEWDGQRFPEKAVPSDWFKEIEDGQDIEINPDHYQEVRAFLEKRGVSAPGIDAFLTIRRKLDEKWIDADRTLRIENLDATTIEEYRSMINQVHNYFPHRRTGNAHVSIIDESSGQVVYREHYNTARDRIMPIGKKARARADTWLKQAIEQGKVKGKGSGFRIVQGAVKKLPDEAFFSIPQEAMQQLVSEAGKRLESARAGYEAERLYNREGKTKKEALELARRRMRADMDNALSKAVAEVFQSRGWAAHAIGRKGIPGHETDDLFGILFDYLSGYAGFKTKISRSRAHHDNLMKVDPKKHPNEYRHLSKYVKDMLANQDRVDRAVDSLRGLFFVKYLGFVVKSGMVNLTQNVVMAAPVLSMHTKGGIMKAERLLAMAMFDTRRALTSKAAWTGGKIDYTTLSRNEQQALHELVESGASMDLFLRELKGNMPGVGWAKHFKKAVDKAGIFMGIAEKFNRASTGLAAYRLAVKEKDMPHAEAVEFAKQVIYDSHFLYGQSNLPTAFRGGDFQKVARAAYTFRSFTHNYIGGMAHLLTNSGWAGKRAFARSLRNLLVVGGLTSIPFFEALSEALLWAMGDDDEDSMTIVRESLPHEWLRDLVVYGLPGAAGVDLTGSLSIEVPRSWKDLVGVPYAMIEDTVNTVESLKSGANFRALSETPFTPIAVRNAMRGIELYTHGQYTRSGKAINYHGARGPRKIGAGEAVLKSLMGLQPVSSSKAYSGYKATRKMQDALQERKSDWANRYVNAMVRMDATAMESVKAEVDEWNTKAREEGKPHRLIDIRNAVAYRLKPNSQFLPKILRKEAEQIAEAWGKTP